ncbi:serine/threonine protein kinase [Candidatus Uabimicrobium sp. HlEnr_7]|uniref:serine/threonine protein kinase n=1 Tax=Candidatus Uabimicrobium helgolandensis TaxID=3095367 RepID=UPI00355836E3
MYKNQNMVFGQMGISIGLIQQQHIQNYIREYPQHTVLLSQWLLSQKCLNETQVGAISELCVRKTANAEDTNALTFKKTQVKNTPKSIGRYQLLSLLGQGGMGRVYKVFDPVEQKELALKVLLLSSDSNQKAVARFKREAKTMSKLNHPGIVRSYEIGEENNQVFFTMDLVDGVSLKEIQTSHPMTAKKSINFIIKVCEVMTYAHEQGVIHRDLKPANIMVKNDNPIIMDFGLAKITEASQELSKTGVIMGTLRYMPPEQAEGRHSDTTIQSDLYSIGAILYELLAKQPVFSSKTHLMLLNSIFTKPPVPLSEVNPKISKELEYICNKALEKKKKNRYKDCRALAHALKRISSSNISKKSSSINRRTSRISSIHQRPSRASGIRKRSSNIRKSSNAFKITTALVFLSIIIFITSVFSNKKTVKPVKPRNDNKVAKKTNSKKQEKSLTIKNDKELLSEEKSNSKEKTAKKKSQEVKIAGFSITNHIVHKNNVALNLNLVSLHPNRGNVYFFNAGGRSQLSVIFSIDKKPRNLFLKLRHLAAIANGKNLSSINVILNGKIVAQDFAVTVKNVPKIKKFEITDQIQKGKNVLSIKLSRRAMSAYWLYALDIVTLE